MLFCWHDYQLTGKRGPGTPIIACTKCGKAPHKWDAQGQCHHGYTPVGVATVFACVECGDVQVVEGERGPVDEDAPKPIWHTLPEDSVDELARLRKIAG